MPVAGGPLRLEVLNSCWSRHFCSVCLVRPFHMSGTVDPPCSVRSVEGGLEAGRKRQRGGLEWSSWLRSGPRTRREQEEQELGLTELMLHSTCFDSVLRCA